MFWEHTAFYLRDVFWLQRKQGRALNTGRTHSAISIRLRGRTAFYAGDQVCWVQPGDVSFIPAGVDYRIENSDEELIILHVDAYGDFSRKITVLTPQNAGQIMDLFRELYRQWQRRGPGCRSLCTARMYEVFAHLEKEQAPERGGKFALLEPGLQYLNAHLEDPELDVGQLADACRISQVYFRRLFRALYGTSPAQAIRQRRLRQAAKLLQTGYYSVSETARLCGFPDAKYFSTAFKTAMGVSPSEYKSMSQTDKL